MCGEGVGVRVESHNPVSLIHAVLNDLSCYLQEVVGFQHRYPPNLILAFHDLVTPNYVVPVN